MRRSLYSPWRDRIDGDARQRAVISLLKEQEATNPVYCEVE